MQIAWQSRSRSKSWTTRHSAESFCFGNECREHPDSIEKLLGKSKNNNEVIQYKQALPDGRVVVAEEVRTGRKTLALPSVRIESGGTPDALAKSQSPEFNVQNDAANSDASSADAGNQAEKPVDFSLSDVLPQQARTAVVEVLLHHIQTDVCDCGGAWLLGCWECRELYQSERSPAQVRLIGLQLPQSGSPARGLNRVLTEDDIDSSA